MYGSHWIYTTTFTFNIIAFIKFGVTEDGIFFDTSEPNNSLIRSLLYLMFNFLFRPLRPIKYSMRLILGNREVLLNYFWASSGCHSCGTRAVCFDSSSCERCVFQLSIQRHFDLDPYSKYWNASVNLLFRQLLLNGIL